MFLEMQSLLKNLLDGCFLYPKKSTQQKDFKENPVEDWVFKAFNFKRFLSFLRAQMAEHRKVFAKNLLCEAQKRGLRNTEKYSDKFSTSRFADKMPPMPLYIVRDLNPTM